MAEFGTPDRYKSDSVRGSVGRHEEGGIISLPDLSDANSSKKKRKISRSTSRKKKPKASKAKIYVKRDNQLVNIKEEDTGTFSVTMTNPTSSNIKVAVRLRPLNQKEIDDDQFEITQLLDKNVVILRDPLEMLNMKDELSKNRSKERRFAFDTVFDKDAGQIEIFNNTTKFLIDGIIEGYNATVFAYGATGAGKTYTMIGTPENPGNMYLTIKELFDRVEQTQNDKSYQIKVSFLEIYNEMIRDLLIISNDVLDLREDADQGTHVAGLSVIDVDSPQEVMDLLLFGNENRTQEATNVNETSSRSHAVLEIQVEQKNKGEGVDEDINIGKLSMIDLAGSERAARTHNRGIRMIEGAMINRSLLSLGNCINALVENMKKGTSQHIPYRDSKLTRLLKDSLGGNSRTVMIANISPSNLCYEDTSNTLKYANRAKNIKTTVSKNVKHVEHHISEYNKIIAELKNEISDLRSKLSHGSSPIKMILSEADTQRQEELLQNSAKIEEFLEKLSGHFTEETKLVKRVDELSNKYSLNKLSHVNSKILLEQAKQRFADDDGRIQKAQKELEVVELNEKDLREKLDKCIEQINENKVIRNQLKDEYSSSGLPNYAQKLLNLQFHQHCNIIDRMIVEIQENDDTDWSKKMDSLKEMDNQILIRDQLIQEASHKLKRLHVPTLLKSALMLKDPYGLCVTELSDTENYSKKLQVDSKLSVNNSLPQLKTLKEREEPKAIFLETEEDQKEYDTPTKLPEQHKRTNSSFESPYMKQRKREIEEIVSRYQNKNMMKFDDFQSAEQVFNRNKQQQKAQNSQGHQPHNDYRQEFSQERRSLAPAKKLKVPYFGKHKPRRKRLLNSRKPYEDSGNNLPSAVSKNSSKISSTSSKGSIANMNDFSLLQVAGMNIKKTKVGPKKSHKPMKKANIPKVLRKIPRPEDSVENIIQSHKMLMVGGNNWTNRSIEMQIANFH